MSVAYTPLKLSRTERHDIRGADYCVRRWGDSTARPLVLLHGTRDASVSFQFLVDALREEWQICAPDWRGHGGSQSPDCGYWFHDYLADFDRLLERLFPNQAVNVVGHSLGGNVATVYAGLRPERIERVVSLDAFGMLARDENDFATALDKWLQTLRTRPVQKHYASIAEMAQRLCAANHRLGEDQALYLASNLSKPLPDGQFTWQFELILRRSAPTFRTLAEWVACWRKIRAPKLWIASADGLLGTARADPESFAYICRELGAESIQFLPDTAHNVHHDAPRPLAAMIERFLCA
jgi:pimeloyl-ACP methyl ester carboxylesterase